jgi:hypothetical protein
MVHFPYKYRMAGLSFVTIMRKAQAAGKLPGRPDSRDWFRNQARRVVHVNVNRLLQDPRTADQMMPGKMYLFGYDPKWKEKLPYYDAFPLIFPFSIRGDRVWGINLHYLPIPLRAALMDELYSLVDNRFKNENKKLRMSYEVLNGAARFRIFKPCIKSYLRGHFMSKFLEIPYDEWDIAMALPLQRFKKASQSTVWEDSREAIREDQA